MTDIEAMIYLKTIFIVLAIIGIVALMAYVVMNPDPPMTESGRRDFEQMKFDQHMREMRQLEEERVDILKATYRALTTERRYWDPGFKTAEEAQKQTHIMQEHLQQQSLSNAQMMWNSFEQNSALHRDDWKRGINDMVWSNRNKN